MDRPQASPQLFQSRGQAWHPDRPDILDLLQNSEHSRLRAIYQGSNHCFLVNLDAEEDGASLAIYKPARGEYPLYDFPQGSLYRREVASSMLDCLLGWNLIPPTVVTNGRHGAGSLQLFIESYGEGELEMLDLQRLALLDVILNNADRKPEHCLIGEDDRLWAIDHGLTFHVQPKLRTILWHFSGTQIPRELHADLRRVLRILQSRSLPEAQTIKDLISSLEWQALLVRVERLVESGCFPDPRYKPVPYRW